MNLKFRWEIDGQLSEWYDRTVLDEEMDQEENWAKINITKDFGVNPILLQPGQGVQILVQALPGTSGSQYPVWVGDEGRPHHIQKIEGQEVDFTTKDSKHNNNNTYQQHGQFPFILY